MQIKTFSYSELEGSPNEWMIDGLVLSARNLLVGKNATGKTRTLNVIGALAKHLAGTLPPTSSGSYDVTFADETNTYQYVLQYEKAAVTVELFLRNGEKLLDRGPGGEGHIHTAEIKGMMRFQTPPTELAAVARRDTIQHGFLEPLHSWGASARHFQFGSTLGKDQLVIFSEKGAAFDERDTNAVVGICKRGLTKYPETFKQAVIRDMASLGYELEDLLVVSPTTVQLYASGVPLNPLGLAVKERELACATDQHAMSQGMFRALSILVQVNYSKLSGHSACLIIDDIGEGLDFDRSCGLIDVLRAKADNSSVQLIMSTNDRFVMNRVPLDEWSVLQRKGCHVKVRNQMNSAGAFEEFKFTGLSNFSLLEMDFLGAVKN